MLEMKQNCETCEAPFGPEGVAFMCSFECSFCEPCTRNVHKMTCPNCGGDLVRRPKRRAKEG